MCNYNHELCQYDLRSMSKHEVNQHYFEFVRNATKEEREEHGLYCGAGIYKCKICGELNFIENKNFKNNLKVCKNECNGVRVHGHNIVVGYNNIAITNPDLVKYFVNKEDVYTHKSGSKEKVKMICPICGKEKEMKPNNLTSQGFSCTYCGDSIPYPEKLMTLVLKELGVDFTKQLTYDNGKHKYDFYVDVWQVIFETHGMQHYEGWNRSEEDLIKQQDNDEYKRTDAINHGILEENYHEIDCRYSTLEWCRLNIEKALSEYIDVSILTDEDWKKFDIQAQKSLRINVCNRWKTEKETDKDFSTTDLVKEFGIGHTTVTRYLTWGNENGFCEYNGKEEMRRSGSISGKINGKKNGHDVYLIKANGEKWFDEPMSQKELAKHTGIGTTTISKRIVNGKPLEKHFNAKFDPKYIGSYVVLAEEYDSQFNKNKTNPTNNKVA